MSLGAEAITVELLAERIGRKVLADHLDVGFTAVSNAVVRNKFPASWYPVVSSLADQKGLPCPFDLFGMKTPARTEAPDRT